jgi:hypothetical protein
VVSILLAVHQSIAERETVPVPDTSQEAEAENATYLPDVEHLKAGHLPVVADMSQIISMIEMSHWREDHAPLRHEAIIAAVHLIPIIGVAVAVGVVAVILVMLAMLEISITARRSRVRRVLDQELRMASRTRIPRASVGEGEEVCDTLISQLQFVSLDENFVCIFQAFVTVDDIISPHEHCYSAVCKLKPPE